VNCLQGRYKRLDKCAIIFQTVFLKFMQKLKSTFNTNQNATKHTSSKENSTFWERHSHSTSSALKTRTPTPSPNFRLQLQDVMCDIPIVYFKTNGEKSWILLIKGAQQCIIVYEQPRTNILSSVYNQGATTYPGSESPSNLDSGPKLDPGGLRLWLHTPGPSHWFRHGNAPDCSDKPTYRIDSLFT